MTWSCLLEKLARALEDDGEVPSSQWLTGHKKADLWHIHEEVISNMMELTLVVEMWKGGRGGNSLKVQLESSRLGMGKKKCHWKGDDVGPC